MKPEPPRRLGGIVVAPTGWAWTLFACLALVGCLGSPAEQEEAPASRAYLDQNPPGLEPEVFAPGIISLPDRGEFASVFSADGNELIFGVFEERAEIRATRRVGDTWTEPQTIVSHEKHSFMDAALTPDGDRLFYISNQPLSGEGEPKDYDLWFSVRTGDGWGPPQHAGPVINSDGDDYYASFSSEGTLYFTSGRSAAEGRESDFDIHAARWSDGAFLEPARLGDAVNSREYDGDVFVAPDESYLIFSSGRTGGKGSGDLYVSFRTESGGWTEAKNMAGINTESQDYCPFVTRDGRYLFFSSNRDIYWVDASVIDTYR